MSEIKRIVRQEARKGRKEGMSSWLHSVYCAGLLALCLTGFNEAHAEIYYSFVVVVGYDEIPPEGLELEYQSMLECEEAQERVVKELESSDDPKLKYIIIDCKRIESGQG